jgi:hypothetical protein
VSTAHSAKVAIALLALATFNEISPSLHQYAQLDSAFITLLIQRHIEENLQLIAVAREGL